jgi:hypothetical protein
MGIRVAKRWGDQSRQARSRVFSPSRNFGQQLLSSLCKALLALLALAGSMLGQSLSGLVLDLPELPSDTVSQDHAIPALVAGRFVFDAPTSSAEAAAPMAADDSESGESLPETSVDFPGDCGKTSSSAKVTASPPDGSAQQPASGEANRPCTKQERRAAARLRDLADPNRNIYYKNKLEFGLDLGYLPINIPFAFDIFLGDGYNKTPLNYTLIPIITSIRWHFSDVHGWSVFRGNWDAQCSFGAVAIPRGPESHYFAWILGIRRNFVPRRIKIAPYFDFRAGMGGIDAKGPLGVQFAQGQDFTFTINVGSGVRYNFNQKYSLSAGLHYMHISNLYLSQPKFPNYGINVYGPMVGIDMRLGKPHRGATE